MGGLHCWYMVWCQGKPSSKGSGLDAIAPCCCFAVDFSEGGQIMPKLSATCTEGSPTETDLIIRQCFAEIYFKCDFHKQ